MVQANTEGNTLKSATPDTQLTGGNALSVETGPESFQRTGGYQVTQHVTQERITMGG